MEEKLTKLTKTQLGELVDLFDLPVAKSATKVRNGRQRWGRVMGKRYSGWDKKGSEESWWICLICLWQKTLPR